MAAEWYPSPDYLTTQKMCDDAAGDDPYSLHFLIGFLPYHETNRCIVLSRWILRWWWTY